MMSGVSAYWGQIVAAGAHSQNPALHRDWPDLLMSLDKGVSHRDSLAKYAATFFRMPRSIRVFANSALSRAISIWSAFTGLTLASSRPPMASSHL